MRIMALDYGDKTVGVSLSDSLKKTAQPLKTITRNNPIDVKSTIDEILSIVSESEVDEIVIGLPLNMNGSEGERVEKTKWFAKKLQKKTDVHIELWDERLSTVAVTRVLDEVGVKSSEQKKYVDKLAATYILQGYIDYKKRD